MPSPFTLNYTGDQINSFLGQVQNSDTPPAPNATNMINSGQIHNAIASVSTDVSNLTMIRQVVQTHSITAVNYSFLNSSSANGAGGTEISELTTSITLAKNNPKIIIQFRVCGESSKAESGFNLYRDSTEIGAPVRTSIGSRLGYFHPMTYDNSIASTPDVQSILYVDDLSGFSAGTIVTYAIKITGNADGTFNLNHTHNDGNSSAYERGTSTCVLQELS